MQAPVIYHNPNCSKSRKTLALIEARGLNPEIIEYLKSPPSTDEIARLLKLLGLSARAMMRTHETRYTELDLDRVRDEPTLIRAMHDHPELIERPIVVFRNVARIGRPPEAVLDIL